MPCSLEIITFESHHVHRFFFFFPFKAIFLPFVQIFAMLFVLIFKTRVIVSTFFF